MKGKMTTVRIVFFSSLILHPSSLLHGIGDDAAVIEQRGRSNTVITSDLLVEDIDFRLKTTSPRLLGHKALAVSLSDIAAMGARPRWASLSIGVPRRIWRSGFLDEFYDGFFALAARYNVALVGGDTSRTRALCHRRGPPGSRGSFCRDQPRQSLPHCRLCE